MVKIGCISDTHNRHDKVTIKPCDILLCAGDITEIGDLKDVYSFAEWLSKQPAKHFVVIAGNHDFCFQDNRRFEAKGALNTVGNRLTYLQDSSVELLGLKIYGSPWSPWFGGWAFNANPGEELRKIWEKIPDNVDIVITHGPPHGYGDMVMSNERVGCEDLTLRLKQVCPKLHVAGHIHEDYGTRYMPVGDKKIICVNATICNLAYEPVFEVTYLDL